MQAALKKDEEMLEEADPETVGQFVVDPGATTAEITPEAKPDRFAAATRTQQSLPISFATAALMGVVLAFSYLEATRVLPAYLFAAGFLVLVVQQDAFRRRIPNWLVGPGILIALAYNTQQFGWAGLAAALIGGLLPFVMLVALYLARSMGAGDIKALMALGSLWGASVILNVIMWSLVIGGVMALVILLVNGELLSMLRRWWGMLTTVVVEQRFQYQPPTDGEAAAGGLPFGIAIGLGVAAAQLTRAGMI